MDDATAHDVDAWLDGLAADPQGPADASRLRAIGAALTNLESAQDALDQAVQEAKDAGESEAAISVVLATARRSFASGTTSA